MEIFENFEWYDFIVIAFFAKVFQVLIIVTLMGGGITTLVILTVAWEGWRFYEKFRAKSVDIR
tara:strand:- start:92 stop:280 length:189 start_codon:yes stop_codon:yes gene_type:complete